MQKYLAVIAVCLTMLILSDKNDALNLPEAAALKMDMEMDKSNPLLKQCACNCAHHEHTRVTRDLKFAEMTPVKSNRGKKPDTTKRNKTKI